VEEVRKLKELPGGDIGISGSVQGFLPAVPKATGWTWSRGGSIPPCFSKDCARLFAGLDKTDLRLVGTTVLDSRVVALDYEPCR
jgi:hypothetical protein